MMKAPCLLRWLCLTFIGVTNVAMAGWSVYTVADGLAGSNVRAMLIDRDGALWIATDGDGVSRYDGDTFENFTTGNTHGGLADNFVNAIFEDADGVLWFGIRGAGVSRYKDGAFIETLDSRSGLVSDFVNAIAADRSGRVWVGTDSGVSIYDEGGFENLPSDHFLTGEAVNAMLADSTGQMWVGTKSGLVCRFAEVKLLAQLESAFAMPVSDGEVSEDFRRAFERTTHISLPEHSVISSGNSRQWLIKPSTGFRCYAVKQVGERLHVYGPVYGLSDAWVSTIVEDKQGHIWFGTHTGLYRYDGETFAHFPAGENGPIDNKIDAILEDSDGNLWFGTDNGVSRYSGTHFRHFSTHDGLSGNRVKAIVQDNEGVLWVGTWGEGICSYDDNVQVISLTKEEITDAAEDKNGHLWFTTKGAGVFRVEADTPHTSAVKYQNHLPDQVVNTVVADNDGNVWFSGISRIARYDGQRFSTINVPQFRGAELCPVFVDRVGDLWVEVRQNRRTVAIGKYTNGQLRSFPMEADSADRSDNIISAVCQDSTGNVWFGTTRSGIYRYNLGGELEHFTTENTKGLAGNRISAIALDAAGNVWFGIRGNDRPEPDFAGGGGLTVYDGGGFRSYSTEDGLGEDSVATIVKDVQNRLWFGTWHGGVSLYNDTGGNVSFQSFTTKDGLASNSIKYLLPDEKGGLWLGTEGAGVSRYKDGHFQTLTTRDGLASNTVEPLLIDRDGNIWFAHEDAAKGKLTRYTPRQATPEVRITQVVAGGERHEIGRAITVTSNAPYISFRYRAVTLSQLHRSRYRYRLDGYDDIWHSTTSREVTYQDLNPGFYQFSVRAIDRDLNLSPPAIVSLRVVLPWYLQLRYAIPLVGGSLFILGTLLWLSVERYKTKQELLVQRLSEGETLRKEMERAQKIQMSLLPRSSPALKGFELEGFCRPVWVGGDFYDYISRDEGVLVVVGDAAGHGLPAAMQARAIHLLLNEVVTSQHIRQPDAILSHLNRILYRTPQEANAVDSTSMCLAYIDATNRELCLSRAGDCRVYRISSARVEEVTKTLRGNAVGAMPPSVSVYRSQRLELNMGDFLLFCSDGLIDAVDEPLDWLKRIDTTSAKAALASIQRRLPTPSFGHPSPTPRFAYPSKEGMEGRASQREQHIEIESDDITFVCMKVTPIDH